VTIGLSIRCEQSRLDRGDVAADCIQVSTLQAEIAIAHEGVDKRRQALGIARDRFKGATSEVDVLPAENVPSQAAAMTRQLTARVEQTGNAPNVQS
jgi:outer membrane protein TolC